MVDSLRSVHLDSVCVYKLNGLIWKISGCLFSNLDWIADLSELSFPGLHASVGIAVPSRICNCLDCSHSRMHGSSGCLGSHSKHKPITSIDESLRGPKPRGGTVSKSSTLGDFWTTSTCEMDNSAVHSHGSVSSISTVDPQGSSSGNIPSEYVNHGLLLWNQTRQQWIGNKKSDDHAQQLREPKLSWTATYESLLGSSKPFPQPIPLSEMVDFLVDVWEQEGLYD